MAKLKQEYIRYAIGDHLAAFDIKNKENVVDFEVVIFDLS